MVRLGGWLIGLCAAVCARAAGLPSYAGAAICGKWHASVTHTWTASRHSKMVQPATAIAVVGDFARLPVTLRGGVYRFRVQAGAYYITESYLTGKPQEHRVR